MYDFETPLRLPLLVYDNVKLLYKNHKSLTALYNQDFHFYVELSSRTGERTINKERISKYDLCLDQR